MRRPAVLEPDKLDAMERRLQQEQQRRDAKRSLAAWARYRGSEPAAHHRFIIREIEDFLGSPSLDVLMFHAPPGSAKSTYVSELLPPWYFNKYPENRILFATHNGALAQRWGRRVRSAIIDERDLLALAYRRPVARRINSSWNRAVNISRSVLASALAGFVPILESVTTCSAAARTHGRRP
jgi:hypothetical protein